MKKFGKYISTNFFRVILSIILSLYIFFYLNSSLLSHANAQVPLPTNNLIQSTTNMVTRVAPTVSNLLNSNGPVSTVNQTVNNIITPAQQQPLGSTNSQTPGSTSTTSTTQYSTTSNTYNSTALPQTNNPNTAAETFAGIANRKDVLLLNHENTAAGKIILTKDINEVIFLSDSLDPLRPPLTFIMPADRDVPILFNFEAFLQTDSRGQHISLPQGIIMEQTAGNDSVSVSLPPNEDIALSESDCVGTTWDGTFTALTILTQKSVNLQGKNVGVPIEIGRNDCGLGLSKQASIFFMNRANWYVGYRLQNQNNFIKITSLCPIANQRECFTNEGKNLLVNTYHFTQFIVFNNQTALDAFLSFLSNTNVIALILAIILTLLLALILGNWRMLKKMGTIAEIDERKSEYVSTVSHELRTPLTAIKGFISMILGGDYGQVKEPMEKPLHEVQTSAQRSINLVNEVLDVSRIESGKMKLTLTEFPLDILLTEVIDFLRPIATEKQLSLEAKNINKAIVQADQEKARQLIINLISNAIKYTESGSISISTKENQDTVTIFVTDTGLGIPHEAREKLFKKFERINTNAEGTGLGLYISRRLAHKMGGDVYLEKSEQGAGSTFALSLLKADSPLAKRLLKKTKS